MENLDYFKKVEELLSNAKERLEKSRTIEKYYESIDNTGEKYKNAKAVVTGIEKEIEALKPFTLLPKVLYIEYASDEQLDFLKQIEMTRKAQRIQSVKGSIAIDLNKVREFDRLDEELLEKYTDAKKSKTIKPTEEEQKIIDEIVKTGIENKTSKEEIEDFKSKKEKELDVLLNELSELDNMSLDDYRNHLLDGIEGSDEILDKVDELESTMDRYELFSKAAVTPERVNELVGLLNEFKEKTETKPKSVYYDPHKVSIKNMPIRLIENGFDRNASYDSSTGEILDIEDMVKTVKEYYRINSVQMKTYEDIRTKIYYFGKDFEALYKYDEACKKANGKHLVYGDPENTDEQNEILSFFTNNRMGRLLTIGYDLFNYEKVDSLDTKFLRLKNKKFISKKRRNKELAPLVDEQIKLIREMRDNIATRYKAITHLPLLECQLYSEVGNDEFHDNMDTCVEKLHEELKDLVNEFEDLSAQYDKNVGQKAVDILEVIFKIVAFTNCDACCSDILYMEGTNDELISKIYEYAALYNTALLLLKLEIEAQQISLSEEATIKGMTPEELAIIKLNEQREVFVNIVEEQRKRERKRTLAKVRAIQNKMRENKDNNSHDYDLDDDYYDCD
ncbi:MAG: hypothetical protein IKZ96_02805 [Bacilli bacterium]|nr:hypothetical protein [Bacilli bacterium]